jgi:predicted phage terminase large subunit-like protein
LAHRTFLLVSFSYPTLRDVVLKTLKIILLQMQALDNRIQYKINESSMTVTIIKGGRGTDIMLRSGSDEDALRGISCSDAGIDEAREFHDRYIYDVLIGRMSDSSDGQIYIASTSKGRNWVWQLAQDLGDDCETIEQSTTDSPFLPSEYVEMLLKNYTSLFARQEIYAEIVNLGAGSIRPEWFPVIEYFKPSHAVRSWDLSVSSKTSADYSAGALISQLDDYTIIHDMIRVRLAYPDLRKQIVNCARADGAGTTVVIEEAGQQRAIFDDLQRSTEMSRFPVRPFKPSKDKYSRAMPWISRAEQGLVKICRGAWNRDFLDECASFSANEKDYEHDDQVDSISQGYGYLALNSGPLIWTTEQEVMKQQDEITKQEITQDPVDGFNTVPAILPGAGPKGFFE